MPRPKKQRRVCFLPQYTEFHAKKGSTAMRVFKKVFRIKSKRKRIRGMEWTVITWVDSEKFELTVKSMKQNQQCILIRRR